MENCDLTTEQNFKLIQTKFLLEKVSKEQLDSLFIELLRSSMIQHNLLLKLMEKELLNP